MGISILGGLLWPRANRWGALASLVAALATNFALYWQQGQRLDHWNANVFLAALLAGCLALAVVSLLTRPEPADQTASFFGRLQTPTAARTGPPAGVLPQEQGWETDFGAAASPSPQVAAAGQQLLAVNLLHLKRAAHGYGLGAYRSDLKGFLRGWLLALGLVLATWIFFSTS